MKNLLEETRGLMPGQARGNWTLDEAAERQYQVTLSVHLRRSPPPKVRPTHLAHLSGKSKRDRMIYAQKRFWASSAQLAGLLRNPDKLEKYAARVQADQGKPAYLVAVDVSAMVPGKRVSTPVVKWDAWSKKWARTSEGDTVLKNLKESVAGAPGAFANSDGPEPTLDGQVAELLDYVRNPTWTYPKWALPRVALDEAEPKGVFHVYMIRGGRPGQTPIRTFDDAHEANQFAKKLILKMAKEYEKYKIYKVKDAVAVAFVPEGHTQEQQLLRTDIRQVRRGLQKGVQYWKEHRQEAKVRGVLDEVKGSAMGAHARRILRDAVLGAAAEQLNKFGKNYGAKFTVKGSTRGLEVRAWIGAPHNETVEEAHEIAEMFLGQDYTLVPHKLTKNMWVAKAMYQFGDLF